jgi:hypothetical protein
MLASLQFKHLRTAQYNNSMELTSRAGENAPNILSIRSVKVVVGPYRGSSFRSRQSEMVISYL